MSEPDYIEVRANHRRTVRRMAATYTPIALGSGALLLWFLLNFISGAGGVLPLIILAVVTIVFTHEAVAALRDLNATPTTMTGQVRRTWSHGMLLWFFRSYYMFVDKVVFEVQPLTSAHVQPGDTVEVEHWPHTRTVIRVRLLGHDAGAGRDADDWRTR